MALDKATLSSLMQTKLIAVTNITDMAELAKFCDAISDAVVSHIQSAAVVNVASVSNVVTGTSASGPGTGTVS